jgi:hypothetical protein
MCDGRLTDATAAMRRHESHMNRAFQLAKNNVDVKQWQDVVAALVSTFNDAQSKWAAYRAHLVEHGILPVTPPSPHL